MSESPVTKRTKKEMRIGTHSGTFHADESLAVYMLRLLPQYSNAGEFPYLAFTIRAEIRFK
jgi:hypothetical protein